MPAEAVHILHCRTYVHNTKTCKTFWSNTSFYIAQNQFVLSLFFQYLLNSESAPMAGRRVVVFPSPAELGPVLAQLVISRAEKAIASRGRFTLGLSGGSLVSMLSKELLALPGLDCSKWVAGFCDERLVPFDDPESTYGLYKVSFQHEA